MKKVFALFMVIASSVWGAQQVEKQTVTYVLTPNDEVIYFYTPKTWALKKGEQCTFTDNENNNYKGIVLEDDSFDGCMMSGDTMDGVNLTNHSLITITRCPPLSQRKAGSTLYVDPQKKEFDMYVFDSENKTSPEGRITVRIPTRMRFIELSSSTQ